MAYPKEEMETMIEQKLATAGFNFSGEINAFVVGKIKGTPFRGQAGISIPPTGLRGNSIIFVVQARDNSRCFKCRVIIPGEQHAARSLFEKLRKPTESIKAPVPAKPPVPLPIQPSPVSLTRTESPSVPSPQGLDRMKLEVAQLLSDQDLLQVLLLSLFQKEREFGSLLGTECITILMAAVGGQCARRQFVPLLEQLIRRGFLMKDRKLKDQLRYALSRKSKMLLQSAVEIKEATRTATAPKNPREGAKLFEIFLEVKDKLLLLQSQERRMKEELAILQDTISKLLKKREELSMKITQALK